MRRLIFPLFMVLAAASCVPSKQYNDLKASQEKCETERQDLVSKNRSLSAENDELKADIKRLTRMSEELKSDTSRINQSARQARLEQERLTKLNSDIMAKLESAKASGNEENRKLVEVLRQTQEDLLRREDKLRELERQLNAKEKRLSDLESELREREARVKELEDLIAQKDEAVRALKERIAEALLGFKDKGLTVEQKNGKIYVSLEAKLLFPSGSTVVNEEGKKALVDLASVVKDEKDITILVEGHTDTDPFNGGGAIKDNWDLSVMRATSVVKIMTAEGKMDPKMLTAAGRGEFVPVAENNTPEGKAKNRRIEIILTPNLDELFQIINE
ncbi:MAG: OmpA family protein [Flavobacteriales bacterium]